RVGAETAGDPVDVRFISATNRDPQEAVERGVLRGDLFYRLRVVPITLPPLRQRPEDIAILANHFLGVFWHRHRQSPDRMPRLTEDTIEFLRTRPWRGNVRELQNVIEHVAGLDETDQTIRPEDVPLDDDAEQEPQRPRSAILDGPFHEVKDRAVSDFERDYLPRLVARAGGNMSKAARQANIDRT